MPEAARSPTEHRRLAAVRRVGLLGTPAEERFDRITRLAKRLFGVPMAVIDIVGEKLAWLKSVQGFDGIEGARCDSYCHHTVLGNDIFLVRDARNDPRVHDSGFADSWVFYAGIPLTFEGEQVGVLCIGDSTPRDLSPDEATLLRDLRSMAEQELMVSRMSETQIALARANEELEMKANIDVLTRVWNRGAILEIAEIERARSTADSLVGILVIDLDHFKAVNDLHGHPAGDEVLRVAGARMRAAVRSMDAVGRYGGEEFLVIMSRVQWDDVTQVAERIRAALASDPFSIEGGLLIDVTCSIGYAIGSSNDTLDTLVRRADEALYRAKSSGRNRVEPQSPS